MTETATRARKDPALVITSAPGGHLTTGTVTSIMDTDIAGRVRLERRALRLCQFSVAWNGAEGVAAVAAGLIAGSVALTGWGIDSGIEVITAILVLLHLRTMLAGRDVNADRERRSLRIVAGTFFVLAVYVIIDSTVTLVTRSRPHTSLFGIATSATALIVMPALAVAKQRVGRQLDNQLVLADGAETMLCAALAAATLTGLVAWTVLGWWWVDPIAGYFIAYFCIKEGREAAEGELVCDDACDDACGG